MPRPLRCWWLPAVVWAVAGVLVDPAFAFSTNKLPLIRTQRTAAASLIISKRPSPSPRVVAQKQREKLHMLPINDAGGLDSAASTLWTAAVEVFDGSSIVDPVVVSDVFWTSLQTKMVTFVLGQVLAAAVFSILLAVFSSQVGKVTGFVTEKFFPTQQPNGLKIPRELRDDKSRVQPDFTKLLICVAIDVVGTSSELIPVLGEVTDVLFWAPIAGLLLRQLYGSNILLVLEFTEEILPLTDVLPLCTLCWVVDTFFGDSRVAQVLQLGQFGQSASASRTDLSDDDATVIDVEQRKSGKR